MSSTTGEPGFLWLFVFVVDSLMFNKVQTQIKFFPWLCISDNFSPIQISESKKEFELFL